MQTGVKHTCEYRLVDQLIGARSSSHDNRLANEEDIGIQTPKKHAGLGRERNEECETMRRVEEYTHVTRIQRPSAVSGRINRIFKRRRHCETMRVKRAIARDRKTGSQFPTLKTANNRGLVEGNQSEEYPDAPQAERIG